MESTLIRINNVDCTAGLTGFDVDRYDLHSSDSGTSISGKENITIIRAKKFKLELQWTNITTAEKNYILSQIELGNSISIGFAWDSDVSLTSISATYRGDVKSSITVNNGTDRRWNLSFSLIEL